MPAPIPRSKRWPVGLGLVLALALLLGTWLLQVRNGRSMQGVASELLTAHAKLKPTEQITYLKAGNTDTSVTIQVSQFQKIAMRSDWISATREIPMGNYAYGSELNLRKTEEHSTQWTVSRRVYVIYRGRDTRAWEYNWELSPASAP